MVIFNLDAALGYPLKTNRIIVNIREAWHPLIPPGLYPTLRIIIRVEAGLRASGLILEIVGQEGAIV